MYKDFVSGASHEGPNNGSHAIKFVLNFGDFLGVAFHIRKSNCSDGLNILFLFVSFG